MSTYSKVDPGTLGWVKSEIDETLGQARLALEAFVESIADKTNLRFCITHLHQVVGTLLMVELDNAAMLAKETEALAEAILDEKVEGSPAVFETLTRGIPVLPDTLNPAQFRPAGLAAAQCVTLNRHAPRGAPAFRTRFVHPRPLGASAVGAYRRRHQEGEAERCRERA